MAENVNQVRELISQYKILVKRAEDIVHMLDDNDFAANYFDTDPRVLLDRSKADSNISICGTNRYYDYDHWDIPIAWLSMSYAELEVAIEEKKRQDEEKKKREEEERKKQQAEEQAKQERIKEAEERAMLARLLEKYGEV